jgi:hypothetical protein
METTPGGLGPGDSRGARESWKVVEDIGCDTRHLRVIVNNPMFFKASNSTKGFRGMLWWMSEFQVYEKNRLFDALTNALPEVAFTDDPADTFRYRFDLSNTIVDMYRPSLIQRLNCYTNDATPLKIGLACKTLILETNDMFDFVQKLATDPADVSVGWKYLVSRLDAASRENEWTVRISPRPDILIGDTVHSSRLDPDRYFLVHGSSIELTATRASQTLTLSDHDFIPE